MKTIIIAFALLILSACVATPNTLNTAAAVAAKPTQESLKSYFKFEEATDKNGKRVSLSENSKQSKFGIKVDDCAQMSIDQYTEDFISESAEGALNDASKTALGGTMGSALLAPVAVVAAPAALAYTAYSSLDAASQIAERFESEKEYAQMMRQCINEAGYRVDFIELNQ